LSSPIAIVPEWPAPPNVRAATTLRSGGVSQGSFASLNLGAHVGDDPEAVATNRRRIRQALALPAEPLWLNQVHGTTVVGATPSATPPTADASISDIPGEVSAVLTADCLPVLICDRAGTRVAAAHAGWRGLAAGVLRTTVEALSIPGFRLMAWLGPAIEQEAFEVGPEVRDKFMRLDRAHAQSFVENDGGRWQADLYGLARLELERVGITAVYGGGFRCYAEAERFFSYRRENKTGRMASLIWLAS
jgi:polyphenol oxidase